MNMFKKFGPIALAALVGAVTAIQPDLIKEYPQAAGFLAMAMMVLSSFAPQPQK